MSKLGSGSMKIGEVIVYIGKLQLFWFRVFFRYFVIAGLFPATAAVIDQLFKVFDGKASMADLSFSSFLESARSNFRQSNLLAYLGIFILGFLYVDLRIAYVLMKNVYVSILLAALIVIFLGSFLYLIPSIVRYDLTLKNGYRQAFFLLLANIPNTIAMLLGMAIALLIGFFIPVLVLIPVPSFLLSNAWFSHQSMRKLEKANENVD